MARKLDSVKGRKHRLLDLFCGAGGCAKGYQRAGFYVVGVDIKPQPNYCGDEFYCGGGLAWLEHFLAHGEWPLSVEPFDAIHASPPCQFYSRLGAMHPGRQWLDLLGPTRDLLRQTGLLFVIENVEDAPMAEQAQLDGLWGILLCGSMFGLGVDRGYLRRHRRFESNVPLTQPACAHSGPAVGVYGHGGHSGKHRMLYRDEASRAMDIDWMSRDEMTQAIPPAYTELIGHQLVTYLDAQKREAA